MKYIVFAANYLPNTGGVEQFTFNLSENLLENRKDVVIVTNNTFKLKSIEKIGNLIIYRLPCFNFMNGRLPVTKLNFEFFHIINLLLKYGKSNYIINTRFYTHSLIGSILSFVTKSKVILIEHGTSHIDFNSRILTEFGKIYEHIITILLKIFIKNFYGVSKQSSNWLNHFKIKSNGEIYNSVDFNKISIILRKNSIAKMQNSIIYAGRLIEEKGILNLLEAIFYLNKHGYNFNLHILGDGELFNKINDIKSEKIHVYGRRTHEEVISMLSKMEYFCLPTDYPEGFPTSIIEAAATKTIIIATDKGGTREILMNDNYGYLLENSSAKEIINSLKYLDQNKEKGKKMTDNAYDICFSRFNWNKNIVEVIGIFEGDVL